MGGRALPTRPWLGSPPYPPLDPDLKPPGGWLLRGTQASWAPGGQQRPRAHGGPGDSGWPAAETSSWAVGVLGYKPGKGEVDLTLHPVQPPGPQPSFLAGHLTPPQCSGCPPARLLPGFVTEPWAVFPEAGQELGLLTHLPPPSKAG